MNKYIPVRHMTERELAAFSARVDASGGENSCWPWTAGTDGRRYGRVKIGGIAFRTHRVAYFIGNGADAGDLMVCHSCDNPPCCNPRHLFLGDHAANMADMASKGRAHTGDTRGEKNGAAKLSDAQVNQVRAMIASGLTNVAIGRVFGVTHQMISRIRRGKAWGCEPLSGRYASIKRA